jgi:ketosteroid isomerase-like protein
MSEENVELVRRWLAWVPDLRDADPADDEATVGRAFRDYLDQEFELRIPSYYPEERTVFKGQDGVARWVGWLRDSWSDWRFWPERFFDAGDHVVVFGRIVAKGRSSGVPIELANAHVFTIRNGRMTSQQVYPDRPEALKAVGLSE